MNAQEIVDMVDDNGLLGLANHFGISRRQAQQMDISARRALHEQRQLSSEAFPTGTRRSRLRRPMPGRAFSTEETANLPGAHVDPAERTYAAQAGRQRRYVLEKNVANGYREWEHELGAMR
jgi:hypothetical protein